jgi:long-chain acyl-CoA synthetase
MVKLSKKTLGNLCLEASAKYKEKIAFSMIKEGKICEKTTYSQMGIRCRQIGALLKKLGVPEGGRVLLLSENCPEWALAYFGIALARAVSVPLLTGFSSEQISYIAEHAQVSAVCLSRSMADKIDSSPLFAQIPLIFIDSVNENEEIIVSRNGTEERLLLNQFVVDTDLNTQCENDLATIIYTSGTSGNSKGVMLSGANVIFCALSSLKCVKLNTRDRLLSVLPLAHSYECSLGLIAPVISGASITYLDRPPSASVLLPAVKLLRPTAMLTVPLLIEKIYNTEIAPRLRESRLYKFPLTRPLAARIAGRRLASTLGGRLRFFGIGGAPLSNEVEKFLHLSRFPYSVGYGLTEAAPLVAGNTPRRFRFNSGIKLLKGVFARIVKPSRTADEGEIQVRGPNIMMGYYNDAQKTLEAFTSDGWLRTGDLGSINRKGRLTIRGRIKALILGPAGENIYPEEIEGLLGTSQYVEDALVYSGKKGELVALVRLTDVAKTAAGAIGHTLEELRAWVNKKLAAFSRVSRIELKDEPFEKTPTMKIKRYLYN